MGERSAKRTRKAVKKQASEIITNAMNQMKKESLWTRIHFGWRVIDQSPVLKCGLIPPRLSMHYRGMWGVQMSFCASFYSAKKEHNGKFSGWSVTVAGFRVEWMKK